MIGAWAAATTRKRNRLAFALGVLMQLGCGEDRLEPCEPLSARADGPLETRCALEPYEDRGYLIHLPPRPDPERALPVVLALHGGAGDPDAMQRLSCPEGKVGGPGCFDAVADQRGFVVVYPSGTSGRLLADVRTWNAGGGVDDLRCVSGRACEEGVDDLAYFQALLDDLDRVLPVKPSRRFVIGMSNGGAMAHRLACANPKIDGIAAVGGANQIAFAQGCYPGRAVPVLQIHGDRDPCWAFEGGDQACLGSDEGQHVSVIRSMEWWANQNGCSGAPLEEPLPDLAPDDGTRALRRRWTGCAAKVELILIEGGGHTWPRGFAYFGEDQVGRISQDLDANAEIWSFLEQRD
jgi:polyhydroxybutyrate depolymerase